MDIKGAIPDLDWVVWAGRRVVIAYDADAVTKELVRISPDQLWQPICAAAAYSPRLPGMGNRKGQSDRRPSCSRGSQHCAERDRAHVDFAGSAWKKDLLRSKPPMNTTEGRILPVLANAKIAAFRHAPEWGGVLAFNEFGFGTVVLKPAPWGFVPKGEWTDHEDPAPWRRNGCSDKASWSPPSTSRTKQFRLPLRTIHFTQ